MIEELKKYKKYMNLFFILFNILFITYLILFAYDIVINNFNLVKATMTIMLCIGYFSLYIFNMYLDIKIKTENNLNLELIKLKLALKENDKK